MVGSSVLLVVDVTAVEEFSTLHLRSWLRFGSIVVFGNHQLRLRMWVGGYELQDSVRAGEERFFSMTNG